MKKTSALILTLFISVLFVGCGGDDSGANTTDAQTFEGGVAFASGQSGTIAIDIPEDSSAGRLSTRAQTSSDVIITGQCIYPDSTVDLNGSFDRTTGDFTLEGGGCTFTGNLNLEDGTFTGSVSCTDQGEGSVSGVESSAEDVLVMCGTWQDNYGTGVWVVSFSDSVVSGGFSGTDGSGTLTGTREGNTLTMAGGDEGYAEGTISGSSVTGTLYDSNNEVNGSFEGSTAGCQ